MSNRKGGQMHKHSILRRAAEVLEQANKSFLYAVIFPLLFRHRVNARTLETTDRLLIIRCDAIGDMILTTPLIRALKSNKKTLKICIAASDRNAQLIAADPDIEQIAILVKNGKLQLNAIQTLRKFNPQVIMNCVTNETTKYGVLARIIARNADSVALAHPQRSEYASLYTTLINVPDMYERWYDDIMLEFARQKFGIHAALNDYLPHISIEKKHMDEAVEFLAAQGLHDGIPALVNLSAGQPRKRWSEEKYLKLIALLKKSCMGIILSSSPEDEDKAESILLHAGNGVCRFRSTNIRGLAAIIARCAFVITPDTSVIHVASAMGTPVVAMYSESFSVIPQWLPRAVPFRAVMTKEYAVEAISPEEVFAGVCELRSVIDANN